MTLASSPIGAWAGEVALRGAEAAALDGVWWLAATVMIAGLVRGFAGFGSALIIMPVASSVLPPVAAIAMLTMAEFFGPLPNLPAAWRDARRREAAWLLIGAAAGLPLGIWVLARVPAEVFGWLVSGVVLVLVPLIATGWRYRGVLTRRLVLGTGAMGGLLAGAVGVPGPPVIMLYMASSAPAAAIRANFLLYLLFIDVMMIPLFLLLGLFQGYAVILGLMLAPPYMLANRLGAAMFRPEAERGFRAIALTIIAASALVGLPLWD